MSNFAFSVVDDFWLALSWKCLLSYDSTWCYCHYCRGPVKILECYSSSSCNLPCSCLWMALQGGSCFARIAKTENLSRSQRQHEYLCSCWITLWFDRMRSYESCYGLAIWFECVQLIFASSGSSWLAGCDWIARKTTTSVSQLKRTCACSVVWS